MYLCSVFSTVSPLGKCLSKVPSFPVEARDPGASVQLLHNYRTHSDSGLHSYLVMVLLRLFGYMKRVGEKKICYFNTFFSVMRVDLMKGHWL